MKLNKEIGCSEVHQICADHQIKIKEIEPVTGSFGKKIFFINHEFLLRVSAMPMTSEQEKFKRIATLDFVPKILHTGTLQRENAPVHYTFLTLLPGDNFVNAYSDITRAQQEQLGVDAAKFLVNLHQIQGSVYDIGLYVPALSSFSGTWREGHQKYWERLKQDAQNLSLRPESLQAFKRAFQFLQANRAGLDYQTGPVLLHNDFHPRNILFHQGKFSGVIDWECSQFGEADFELCHLVHWTLYPPKPGIDFRPFLRALFQDFPICALVPHLALRLTMYQIEHEIQQIIWNAKEAEDQRITRLVRWMDRGVEDILKEIH